MLQAVGERDGPQDEQRDDGEDERRTIRQTVALNAACPAKNSIAPPSTIHAVDVAGCARGCSSTRSSAAAATMMPAIMIGWIQ